MNCSASSYLVIKIKPHHLHANDARNENMREGVFVALFRTFSHKYVDVSKLKLKIHTAQRTLGKSLFSDRHSRRQDL